MTEETPQLLSNDIYCVTLNELAQTSGFSVDELRELVELGALEPRTRIGEWIFAAHTIAVARVARRLQGDFDLPLTGVALVLEYRARVRELEARVREIECLLPR